ITGMSTHRAGFARIVRVYLNSHTAVQEGFIGNHALQFGKGPFGVGRIRLVLLLARLLAMLAPCALSDVCQVLQTDKAMRMLVNDTLGDHMIGVLLQPSLSTADHHQAAGSGTSAFLLQ